MRRCVLRGVGQERVLVCTDPHTTAIGRAHDTPTPREHSTDELPGLVLKTLGHRLRKLHLLAPGGGDVPSQAKTQ